MIVGEISRISDHLTCIGATAMELGAFTSFLYMIKAREILWDLVEELVTGARAHHHRTAASAALKARPAARLRGERPQLRSPRRARSSPSATQLLTRNRIFVDRMQGVGVLSAEDAIAYAVTGPLLRATGVPYDVRKARRRTWSTTGSTSRSRSARAGDNYDRYLVRMAEMEQTMRIIEQALARSPAGRSTSTTRGARSSRRPSTWTAASSARPRAS